MNFFKKKKQNEDIYDDNDLFFDDEKEYYGQSETAENAGGFDDEPETAEPAKQSGVSFAGTGAPVSLKVVKPLAYDEGPEIADFLAGGSTVLLNIEQLDKNAAKRLLDFMLGACHVLGGTMSVVAKGTFVFAPKNVGVSDLSGLAAAAQDEAE